MNQLISCITQRLPQENLRDFTQQTEEALDALFGAGGRFHKNSRHSRRVSFMSDSGKVSFAGLVHEESPSSGVYGGMSLIWFPVPAEGEREAGSLLTFVCGTRGLAPDEHILGRPGHARHLQALRRYLLQAAGVSMWVKQDPSNLNQPFPRIIAAEHPAFHAVFERYGNHIYACVKVPPAPERAGTVVTAFLDFYATERNWQPLSAVRREVESLRASLRAQLFPKVDLEKAVALLRERRFMILQGPPGTGKSRLARNILQGAFAGHGRSVQFHPAVTYETFITGLAPDADSDALHFSVREGWLLQAIRDAAAAPRQDFLLHIDEINRADLGRVLGEAIYLFEPSEIAAGEAPVVRLPHASHDGRTEVSIPPELFVLGTMNAADRSIAILDLAVRRRFAFVDVWPDMKVVEAAGLQLATEAFSRLQDIFAQYAPEQAMVLLPGHAYFLAQDEAQLRNRLRFELLPLLREYLLEGRLGVCESELHAYIDWLEGELA